MGTQKVSQRGDVPPFIVMDVMNQAAELEAQGRHICHMEVGQPAVGIPGPALEVTLERMRAEPLAYTLVPGKSALREAISTHYTATYGQDVSPSRIIAGMGSSAGFELAFISAFDAGAKVALAAPGYPAYRHILKALDIQAVLIPARAETGFRITPDVIIEAGGSDLDGLIVASPANPTGTIMSPEDLLAVAEYCAENGIRLISDEIYHGISFGKQTVTAANMPGSPIVLNSFSKYFCMTGWRLGWMVVPEDMTRRVQCLAGNMFISAPAPSQIAGEEVFRHRDYFDTLVEGYAEKRRIILDALPAMGLTRLAPADGAFYIYVDVSDVSADSMDMCTRLLQEAGVATAPGIDFDPQQGHKFLRMSFAGSKNTITEAMSRLGDWVSRQ